MNKNEYEIDFTKVGQKMKQMRMEQGVTQEKVAEDLECTVAFVSNVENSRTKLNLRVLLYYSKLCNMSVDSILAAGKDSESIENTDNDPMYDELIGIFKTFSADERRKIIRMLKVWKGR
ncbi:MAG: helix-turn-helix domain-containing protein [Lachnospiraceae bacterium]|nr:helix-turn-helix domain-containing protein [Lachnospiraceae bacterium]MDE6251270.1 helix-turn-helix domain-containing protein [Lachnospiraceae bacterium]